MSTIEMLDALRRDGESFVIEPTSDGWAVHSPEDIDGDMFGFCTLGKTLDAAVGKAYAHIVINRDDCVDHIGALSEAEQPTLKEMVERKLEANRANTTYLDSDGGKVRDDNA